MINYKNTSMEINGGKKVLQWLLMFLLILLISFQAFSQTTVNMDASAQLNNNADKVGIWVNTNTDDDNVQMIEGLQNLNFKSLRYGWAQAAFDKNNLNSQLHRPNDRLCMGFVTENGRVIENFGPDGVADLLGSIQGTGFGVVNTDGIRYIGTADAELAAMSDEERLELFTGYAVDWATWGKDNRFEFYEIGNENDLFDECERNGVISGWNAPDYARVAKAYNAAIKAADPNAKTGINGGLLADPEERAAWFADIANTEPSLADDLDFLVAHNYAFWLDYNTWRANPSWDIGSIDQVVLESRNEHFPDLPIHVTEIGSFLTGQNEEHYRAVLMTEMLGNVYNQNAVEHVHVWPTRWATQVNGVFFPNGNYDLTPMGLGVMAYTKFAKPIMFSNGSVGTFRYFASRNDDQEMTVWLANHSVTDKSISVNIDNFSADLNNEAWVLKSASNTPDGEDTRFFQTISVMPTEENGTVSFEARVPPTSMTVIHFSRNADNLLVRSEETLRPIEVYPNPTKEFINVSGNGFYDVSIVNINGQEVIRRTKLSGNRQVPLQGLAPGVYLLNVLETNGVTRRFNFILKD